VIGLIAVRHGETEWNRVRRLQGHTDIALNATGIEQAARLAAALVGESIAAIYSSDLVRALVTAEPVATALGLQVKRDPLLRERNYGLFEGKTFAEIVEHHPEEAERLRCRDTLYRIPNGESQNEFFARVIGAIRAIASQEERALRACSARDGRNARTILVVTHGGVLDMLYRAALDLPLAAERSCAIPNAVINRIDVDDGRFRVKSWAEAP
jgi:2,3-bisphosphoglycerate-dependent phosphoglycerate mutase